MFFSILDTSLVHNSNLNLHLLGGFAKELFPVCQIVQPCLTKFTSRSTSKRCRLKIVASHKQTLLVSVY
jgi:hypothetical protein